MVKKTLTRMKVCMLTKSIVSSDGIHALIVLFRLTFHN